MRLTSFTDYAVRVLMYVAVKEGELASIKEVSKAYQISSNHLMKVVHVLGKGGYLETIRGKNGGFRLGMAAEDIKIGDLIRYTEDDLDIVDCIGTKKGLCILEGDCNFGNAMGEALGAFLETANQYTIASLIQGSVTADTFIRA